MSNELVEQIEGALKDVAKIKPKLEKTAAEFDVKIAALKTKKAKAVKPLLAEVFLVEKKLHDLAKGYEFPKKNKTLFFEIGSVNSTAQPDALIIADEEKTKELVKSLKFIGCYKEEIKLVKIPIRNLSDTQLENIGAKLVPVDDKLAYSLAGPRKTSTGLVFPEVDMSTVK